MIFHLVLVQDGHLLFCLIKKLKKKIKALKPILFHFSRKLSAAGGFLKQVQDSWSGRDSNFSSKHTAYKACQRFVFCAHRAAHLLTKFNVLNFRLNEDMKSILHFDSNAKNKANSFISPEIIT